MKVLVVEDDLDVGAVFRDFLLELGHEAVLARSTEAALGKLETAKPDAIMNLPGMSGLEFLQLRPIRESGLPVVALSGVATEAQARECLRLGAVDFVGKPVRFERLRGVLAYLEPHALFRWQTEPDVRIERRRSPRVSLVLPVRVAEYSGAEWETYSMNLSQFGIKIRSAGDVRAEARVHAARRRQPDPRHVASGPRGLRRLRLLLRESHRRRVPAPGGARGPSRLTP